LKQLKLKFDFRRLLFDARFKKYTVNLYRPNERIPTVVSGIWAINPNQAIVKAIKTVKGRGYSMKESRAYPQKT